jgi:hypothetical protein
MYIISFTPGCNKDIDSVSIIATFRSLQAAQKNLCKFVGLNDVDQLSIYAVQHEYDIDEYVYEFDFIEDYNALLGISMIHHGRCINGLKFRINKIQSITQYSKLKRELSNTIY